jgi:beta-glucosidase/6-phospho-beta-glucosidase/beta-galactosidase
VDYKDNQKRHLKESAKWYSEVIKQNGVKIKD